MPTIKELEAAHTSGAALGAAEELRAAQAMLAEATTEIVRSLMRDRVRRMQVIARDYAAEAQRAAEIRQREIADEAARPVYMPRQTACDHLLAARMIALRSRKSALSREHQLMLDL